MLSGGQLPHLSVQPSINPATKHGIGERMMQKYKCVELLKAAGYNAIRCAHNLPATALLKGLAVLLRFAGSLVKAATLIKN